ncbi:MAG: beta-propeller fold lactonase family protein [Bryocella sp.]
MKLSLFGRLTMALLASMALGLGMTACGGGTVAYIWVLGQQYNQIAGFKVDDYTGNLTTSPTSPFSAGGAAPVSIIVKAGGRFIYVVNQGTGGTNLAPGTGQNIVELAVGGDGTLTYQATFHSQGFISKWAQFDPTSGFLYVLDQYAPPDTLTPTTPKTYGSITTFASDPTTGRLTLITNAQTKTSQGLNTNYWAVGNNPIMMKTAGTCLFTVNGADQSVSPYSFGGNGQLITTTTGTQPLGTTSATSINGNGANVYITDSNNGSLVSNYIHAYSVGAGCALNLSNAGIQTNLPGTANPTYSVIDNSGKYLYVLNGANTAGTTGQPYSSISGYVINSSTTQLTPISTTPFSVGSGPVCMVEDSTNKYVYISNRNDGTITGKVIDPTTGNLSDLPRGSTFNATGQAGCLVLSGAVS